MADVEMDLDPTPAPHFDGQIDEDLIDYEHDGGADFNQGVMADHTEMIDFQEEWGGADGDTAIEMGEFPAEEALIEDYHKPDTDLPPLGDEQNAAGTDVDVVDINFSEADVPEGARGDGEPTDHLPQDPAEGSVVTSRVDDFQPDEGNRVQNEKENEKEEAIALTAESPSSTGQEDSQNFGAPQNPQATEIHVVAEQDASETKAVKSNQDEITWEEEGNDKRQEVLAVGESEEAKEGDQVAQQDPDPDQLPLLDQDAAEERGGSSAKTSGAGDLSVEHVETQEDGTKAPQDDENAESQDGAIQSKAGEEIVLAPAEPHEGSVNNPSAAAEFPPIIVHYKGDEYPFFSLDSNGFFSDVSILDHTMESVLSGLRSELSEETASEDELVLQVDELGLEFAESQASHLLSSITLRQVTEIFDLLVTNQDPDDSRNLYMYLLTKPNVSKRYEFLVESATAGQGLEEVMHLYESASMHKIATDIVNQDHGQEGATEDNSPLNFEDATEATHEDEDGYDEVQLETTAQAVDNDASTSAEATGGDYGVTEVARDSATDGGQALDQETEEKGDHSDPSDAVPSNEHSNTENREGNEVDEIDEVEHFPGEGEQEGVLAEQGAEADAAATNSTTTLSGLDAGELVTQESNAAQDPEASATGGDDFAEIDWEDEAEVDDGDGAEPSSGAKRSLPEDETAVEENGVKRRRS